MTLYERLLSSYLLEGEKKTVLVEKKQLAT